MTSNNLAIPISGRLQFGKKIRFFIKSGCFFDFLLFGQERGTYYSYVPDENNQTVFTKNEYDGKADIRPFNFGLAIGVGLKIPAKKIDITVKPDYRYGLIPSKQGYEGAINNQYVRLSVGIGWGRAANQD